MVQSQTILRDTIFYVKDFLLDNITDPISSTRPSGQSFVLTAYPERDVVLPIITVKDTNSFNNGMLGFQSEASEHFIEIEIRIWARTNAERDKIADEIYQEIKDNQIGASGTSQANDIHDLRLLSSVNVDEPKIRSKVMTFRFLFIAV